MTVMTSMTTLGGVASAVVAALFVGVYSFLMTLRTLIRWLAQKQLSHRNPLFNYVGPLNDTQRAKYIADLRLTNDGPLEEVWASYVKTQSPSGIKVLLTGVTGYVGGSVLYELLHHIHAHEQQASSASTASQHFVYITVRGKKNSTKAERLAKLRDDPILQSFVAVFDRCVRMIEITDLGADLCGMTEADVTMLAETGLTHVIHCAADVRFNPPMDSIAAINITATLQLATLARTRFGRTLQRFVYVSTAFVHQKQGTAEQPNAEDLYDLQQYRAADLYQSMKETATTSGDLNTNYAEQAKRDLGFKNNYVMSKCTAEHLLVEQERQYGPEQFPLTIIRPSIVGPAAVVPFAGWNGPRPSTVTGMLLLCRARIVKVTRAKWNPRPGIPVDVVSVSIVHALVESHPPVSKTATAQEEEDLKPSAVTSSKAKNRTIKPDEVPIRNLVWGFWVNLPDMLTFGITINRVPSTEAVLLRLVNGFVLQYPFVTAFLGFLINRLPLHLWDLVQQIQLYWNPQVKLPRITAKKLLFFLDLLSDWDHFMTNDFVFQVSTRLPTFLNRDYYLLVLLRSVEYFLPSFMRPIPLELESQPEDFFSYAQLNPKWRLGGVTWWAETQPLGDRAVREAAAQTARWLTKCARNFYVNVASYSPTATFLEENYDQVRVCLIPFSGGADGHSSHSLMMLDMVLLTHLCFCMPGFGLYLPRWVVANDWFKLHVMNNSKKNHGRKNKTIQAWARQPEWLSPPLNETNADSERRGLLASAETTTSYIIPMTCKESQDWILSLHQQVFENSQAATNTILVAVYLDYDRSGSSKDNEVLSESASLGDIRVTFGAPYPLTADKSISEVQQEIQRYSQFQRSPDAVFSQSISSREEKKGH